MTTRTMDLTNDDVADLAREFDPTLTLGKARVLKEDGRHGYGLGERSYVVSAELLGPRRQPVNYPHPINVSALTEVKWRLLYESNDLLRTHCTLTARRTTLNGWMLEMVPADCRDVQRMLGQRLNMRV